MDIKRFLSKTIRKKIVSLAMPVGLALSILIGSTVTVNATVVSHRSIVNSAMIQSTSVGIGKISDRITIGQTETLVAENQLIDNSISDDDINKAVDINFTPNISANDLKIESWKMYNNGNEVEFFITYESGIDRYVSFFNPPDGDIFMKTSGTKLSAGKNSLKFKIPIEQYNNSKGRITMKFWESESDRNFIWLNSNQKIVTNQLIDNNILDDDISKAVDINFTPNILADDLRIESWKMYNNGNEVEFFVTYESGIDRYVSFFNPPNGDIFMKTSGAKLSAGKNNLKFKIPVNQYNSVKDSITMKFWESESDRNFICFNPNQLIDNSISDDDINKAVDVNFTPNISANDLKIESWKMYNNGSEVEFFVTYESSIDRYVSFFNSPNGDIFMKISGAKLSAGKNNLKFKIPVSQYNNVKDSITMKFWESGSDRNFIWFNPNQKIVTNQLIDNSIPDDDISKAIDINFIPNILADDLKIESWKMYNNGNEVEFFVTYESDIDRYVSFFNPPNGDIFMKISGAKLSAGKNNLKFKIPVKQYNSLEDGITMKFWETESDRNFIWFDK